MGLIAVVYILLMWFCGFELYECLLVSCNFYKASFHSAINVLHFVTIKKTLTQYYFNDAILHVRYLLKR